MIKMTLSGKLPQGNVLSVTARQYGVIVPTFYLKKPRNKILPMTENYYSLLPQHTIGSIAAFQPGWMESHITLHQLTSSLIYVEN